MVKLNQNENSSLFEFLLKIKMILKNGLDFFYCLRCIPYFDCKNKKDAAEKVKEALKHIFKEIGNRVDVEQCAAFCVDQDCNRIDPHFADKSGYLKCGIIYKRGEEICKEDKFLFQS